MQEMRFRDPAGAVRVGEYADGTVTAAGREFGGLRILNVFGFDDNHMIKSPRIYLDYSRICSELPEDVPTYSIV
jgi:hypothetical protein